MAFPGMEISHAFGSLCGMIRREAVIFGDESGEYLVNPVGRRMAFRNIANNEMNLVIESQSVEAITAVAVSRDRAILAVCQICATAPFTQVSVYDMRIVSSRPTQTLEEIGGAVGRIVCASFSPDEAANLLCFASVSPECLLVVLDWRSNKVVGKCVLDRAADQVAISPLNSHLVSASGENFIGLWTAHEGEFQACPPFSLDEEPLSVTDHAWLQPGDDMLALCTGQGSIHILSSESMALTAVIRSPFRESSRDSSLTPLCIRCYHRGFIVGAAHGTIAIWEACEEDTTQPSFKHVRTVCVRHADAAVCCIDIVSTDDSGQLQLALGFDDAQIGHTSTRAILKGLDLCTIVSGGFHSGPINSCDLAAQRPIIATMCAQEASVRIWNYALRRCELHCSFPGEELTSIAIHPFGYFLAVSFNDKLRFYQILVNELKQYRELSNGYRGIRFMRFSNGGHLLAVAQSKLVIVINTKTLHRVATLKHHVTSLCFDPEDQVLVTCGEGGSLYEWSTHGWEKKERDPIAKSKEGIAITAGDDGFSCCSMIDGNRPLLQVRSDGVDQELPTPNDARIDALCYQTGPEGVPVVLAGTSTGMLWVCQAPVSLESSAEGFYGLHAGAITGIRVSADNRIAVTAGEDGAIFVMSISGVVSEVEGTQRGDPRNGVNEIVMINRGEIQVKQEEVNVLETENNTLETRLEEEKAKVEGECRTRVSAARQKDQEEIVELRSMYESLQERATTKERENLKQLKTMEANHMLVADNLESVYDKKISSESDRFAIVESALTTLQKRIEVLKEDSQAQLEQVRLGLQEDLRRQVAGKDAEIQKLKDLLAFSQHRSDMMLSQEENEYDFEIAEIKKQSQEELEQQRMIEYKLKKEQDTLLRGLDKMEHDRDQGSKKQIETKVTIHNLTKETTELTNIVDSMKSERREREAILREKELQIGAYKLKVNTLKKFKHVLDFRLREVAESLQPKDQMIEQLNEDLRILEGEFERQLALQHHMDNVLKQKESAITDYIVEADRLREVIRLRERRIQRFHTDLHDLVQNERDIRRWPDAMKEIYHEHVNAACIAKDDEDKVPIEELRRQTRLMDKKSRALSQQQGRDRSEVQARHSV